MSDLGNKETMSKNIKYYMNKRDKTRKDICSTLGIKYTTFSDWVNGNSYPRIDKIELLANYFGIQKSDLVERHEDESTGYYTNSETKEMVQFLAENPEYRLLFDAAKDLCPEDIEIATNILDRLKKGE